METWTEEDVPGRRCDKCGARIKKHQKNDRFIHFVCPNKDCKPKVIISFKVEPSTKTIP